MLEAAAESWEPGQECHLVEQDPAGSAKAGGLVLAARVTGVEDSVIHVALADGRPLGIFRAGVTGWAARRWKLTTGLAPEVAPARARIPYAEYRRRAAPSKSATP